MKLLKGHFIINKGRESIIVKNNKIDNYVIKLPRTDKKKHIIKEIAILKLLFKHPYIINILKYDNNSCIYYRYYKYDLHEYIMEHKKIKYIVCLDMFYKIIDAVDFIHSLGLIHCDIKPENILLDENLNPKLIDFGFTNVNRSFGEIGTSYYISPEMYKGCMYDYRTDLWSLGILLYVMYYGHLPFYKNAGSLYNQTIHFTFKIKKKKDIIFNIIQFLLVVNPCKRSSLQFIKKMNCFDKYKKKKL